MCQPGWSRGASENPVRQARRCLSEDRAKDDFTAKSASQTCRVGGGGRPPRRGGTWTVLTGKERAWGPKSEAGESGQGRRLALKRRTASFSPVPPEHITLIKRKKKKKSNQRERAQIPQLALFLGGD